MPVAAVAGIGAVGSIIGGINSASAAKKAAAAQAKAAQEGIDYTKQAAADAKNYQVNTTNEQRGNIKNWIDYGRAANTRLGQLMGLNPEGAAPIGQPLAPGASSTAPVPAQTAAVMDPRNMSVMQMMVAARHNPNTMEAIMAPNGQKYSHGGVVRGPGTGTSDSVPIHASRGEGILTAAAMRMPGVMNMVMHLNRVAGARPHVGGRRFADGGMVQPGSVPPGYGQPVTDPSLQKYIGEHTMGTTLDPGNPAGGALGGPNSGPTGVMTGNIQPPPTDPLQTVGSIGGSIAPPPGGMTVNDISGSMGGPTTGPTGLMTPADGTAASLNPAVGAGSSAGGDFGSLSQGFGEAFKSPTLDNSNDPGYQFRLDEGRKAIERSAAARGGLLSGGTAKALSDYGQNAASAEYGNVYDRAHQQYMDRYNIYRNNANDLYNRLIGISGSGEQGALGFGNELQAGAGNYGNIDMSSADAIARLLGGQGAANASGIAGSANAWNSAIGGVTNAASLYALLRNRGASGGSQPWLGMAQ